MNRFKLFFRANLSLLCAAFLTVLLGVQPGYGQDNWRFGLEIRPLEFEAYPNFLPNVSNIPPALRTVPINPGDAGAGTPVLIPGSSVQPGSYVPVGSSIAPEISYRRLTLRAGGVFFWEAMRPQALTGSSGSTQEENYQGEGRTEGAALVYYAVLSRPSYIPGGMGEIELRASRHVALLAGYQVSGEHAIVQQGWDRYNSLQSYRNTFISNDLVQRAYGGIRLSRALSKSWTAGVFVLAGPAFISQHPTSAGSGAVLGYAKSPMFISSGFDLHWDWHRQKSGKKGE